MRAANLPLKQSSTTRVSTTTASRAQTMTRSTISDCKRSKSPSRCLTEARKAQTQPPRTRSSNLQVMSTPSRRAMLNSSTRTNIKNRQCRQPSRSTFARVLSWRACKRTKPKLARTARSSATATERLCGAMTNLDLHTPAASSIWLQNSLIRTATCNPTKCPSLSRE